MTSSEVLIAQSVGGAIPCSHCKSRLVSRVSSKKIASNHSRVLSATERTAHWAQGVTKSLLQACKPTSMSHRRENEQTRGAVQNRSSLEFLSCCTKSSQPLRSPCLSSDAEVCHVHDHLDGRVRGRDVAA